VNDRLAVELVEVIASSPTALERLREPVEGTSMDSYSVPAPAFTVGT